MKDKSKKRSPEEMTLKDKMHEVIFEADTKEGKLFDVTLLILILLNVLTVMLESVPHLNAKYGNIFAHLEVFFTIYFTIEYILRVYCVSRPIKYMTSFFGVIDLLSILPYYLGLLLGGIPSLTIVRGLRLLRIFRVFKLGSFLHQGDFLLQSLKASRNKIFVFLLFITIFVSIMGSVVYIVEANSNSGFDSIPRSIYWAIVTITTVGYGDISPVTPIGQFIASIVMLSGYAIIALPTGIVTHEAMKAANKYDKISTQTCQNCSKEGHDYDAEYCKYCGHLINEHE